MNRSSALAFAALAAFVPAQVQAQAARPCLTEREVAHMTIYAVPSMVEGVRGKCANRLAKTGFVATKGKEFSARYAALQSETWPTAKVGIMKYIGAGTGTAVARKGNDPMAMVAALPDESVRPLVDAMIAQKIGESIAPERCTSVERGMQLASVMNPRDSGALIAFVIAMAKPKSLQVCQAS